MSKIYLKKTYDSNGNENYQFVKKYLWGLITKPICLNIVKKMYCDVYEVYGTPVIFTNIETAKNVGSYFIGNKTINIDDNTSIELKDGYAKLENQLVRPAILSFDIDYEEKGVAYVNYINDIWWWLPQHLVDYNWPNTNSCKLDVKYKFFYNVKYCCKLDNLINTIRNVNKQKDVEFIPFEI